jgi:hypothetical protein
MSSHIRYLLMMGGAYRAGMGAKQYLAQSTGLSVKTKEQMITAAKVGHGQLWVFREPRKLALMKSRYKLLCNRIGIGKPKKQKKAAIPRLQFRPPNVHYPILDPQMAGLAEHGGQANGANIAGGPPVQAPRDIDDIFQ